MAPLLFHLFIVFIALPAIVPVRSSKQKQLKAPVGGSISIPCFYGQQYKNSVKCWCKGKVKSSCSPETRSDAPRSINRVSITDDPHNLVFIVTMKNLQMSDEGRYWCAVDDVQIHKAISDEEYNLITTAKERSSTLKTFSYLRGQTGGSITIPCFYGQEHKNHVKYWCKSGNSPPCTPATKATQTKGTITDDPDNLVFLVTMTNLQQSDSGNYWCSVGEERTKETSDNLLFLVTPNAQSVRTESWVSAQRGGSVTIPCYYDQNYKDKTKYLCRGYDWDSCSRIAQSDGEQSRGTVSVSDDRDQMVFNVTIRDLQEEDFDYYWCAVEASVFMPLKVREVIHVTTTQETEWVTSPLTHPHVTLTPNITGQSFIKSDSRGRALHITLHTAVGLVYLICTMVAVMRTWRYCTVMQCGVRRNLEQRAGDGQGPRDTQTQQGMWREQTAKLHVFRENRERENTNDRRRQEVREKRTAEPNDVIGPSLHRQEGGSDTSKIVLFNAFCCSDGYNFFRLSA